MSQEFAEVLLSNINPEKELPADLYVHVDGKYIKFRQKGDQLTVERFDQFISKGVKNLFIDAGEIMSFLEWVNTNKENQIEELIEAAGEENRGFFVRDANVRASVYETFFEEDLTSEVVEKLQESVKGFVAEISNNPITAKAIAALADKNATIADHSVSVANLSVYLALVCGHGHQFVLENIYMGAIFHDYGKAKIPIKELENQGNRLYSQAIQDHPEKGAKMLQKTEGMPIQVINIVLQHHEQFNGHGYPKGLSGDQVYELAQIVSMANIFDNVLMENRKLPVQERVKRAIKVIEYDNGKNWNPKFFPRVVDALQKIVDTIVERENQRA
ncbi:MAG: hypothetical protein OHK0056_27410 [Bacteriovoracaceae bacterium]